VLESQGDLGGAQKAYRESLATVERLAQLYPTNALWQQDLFVNYAKLAQVWEQGNPGEARAWWGKAYDQLSGMKKRGIMQEKDERHLPGLRAKAGR